MIEDIAETLFVLYSNPVGGWIFGFIMALVIIMLMIFLITAMYRGKLYSTRQIDKILEYIRETLRDFEDH
jgi:uncharacterized membrane protein